MPFLQAFAVDDASRFRSKILHRLKQLRDESGLSEIVVPVGLFFLIDTANGGDATADELVRRFNLLDFESRDVIDFYFVGWRRGDGDGALTFSLPSFEAFRSLMRSHGIRKFGGNADLILVDAKLANDVVSIDFTRAIRVDLARAVAENQFPTLGSFLQSVIDAAEDVRASAKSAGGSVLWISGRLGLAVAGRSILDFIYEKWGKIVGAKKLEAVAVKNLGPELPLAEFI